MSEKKQARVIDHEAHVRHRAQFSYEEMRQYAGEFIAWSFEGDRIVAHGRDIMEVDREVIAQGINPEEVVYEQMPPADRFEELY